jgi:polyisoprenoid-binding protein YceI
MKVRRMAVVFSLVAVLAGAAAAQDFKIDPAHSQVGFGVKHLMISTVSGRFTEFSGTVHYDAKDASRSSVNVSVKTASITTDNAGRDDDLRKSEFLDVAKFPEMTFQSTKVEKRGGQLVLVGNLTLKGVSKPVEIPFTLGGPITDPWGNQRIAAEGSTTINRRDFGVTYNRKMQDGAAVVADEVKISLSIEAVVPKAK